MYLSSDTYAVYTSRNPFYTEKRASRALILDCGEFVCALLRRKIPLSADIPTLNIAITKQVVDRGRIETRIYGAARVEAGQVNFRGVSRWTPRSRGRDNA